MCLSPKKKTEPQTTTIAISLKNRDKLNAMRKGFENYDAIITRLINATVDVYHEFILIDNELPSLHTCVFQLGDDSGSLYRFDGSTIEPITKEQANRLMKQPKPNFTKTKHGG